MNSRQEAILNMFRTVQQLFNDNATIIAANPAFMAVCNLYNLNVSSILSATSIQEQIITGIVTDKTVNKENLCKLTTDVAGLVFAFAVANNNNQLKEEVDYNVSSLMRLKDDILAPVVRNIHAAATTNQAELLDYGITPAVLQNFQDAIDNYSDIVPRPRTARSVKSATKDNLKVLIKDTTLILKMQLDKLIVNFKTDHPEFVNTYKIARKIIDPGTSTTKITGTITSSDPAEFISGATVKVKDQVNTATTDSKGKFTVAGIAPGTYTLLITKQGFKPTTFIDVVVKLGQATKLDIVLLEE